MNIAVYGGSGRMGAVFCDYAATKGHSVFVVDKKSPTLDIPFYSRLEDIIQSVDVVVDFSSPQGLNEIIPTAERFHKPLVSGTTGISNDMMIRLKKAGEIIPIIYAPNFSLGITLIKILLKNIPQELLKEFNIHIEEIHHKNKKDKPSGTAKMLGEILGNPEISSIRVGGERGVHKIYFYGEDEAIELSHRSVSRIIFARGALTAAQFIVNLPPGIYTTEELWTGKK